MNFPSAPTFATPIEKDPTTGRETFSPLWLQWFLDVARYFSAAGPATPVNSTTVYAALGARLALGVLSTDDLIVNLATKGLVLKDTQGTPHYWRVTVNNSGALVVSDLGTTLP